VSKLVGINVGNPLPFHGERRVGGGGGGGKRRKFFKGEKGGPRVGAPERKKGLKKFLK